MTKPPKADASPKARTSSASRSKASQEEIVIIDQNVTIAAPAEKVWDFMMDVPAVSTCVPGVEEVTQVSPDVYRGILGVKVGPVGVRLEGQVKLVEQDRENWQARMDVEATDRRIPGAGNA